MKKSLLIIPLLVFLAAAPAWAAVSISVFPPSPTTDDRIIITVSESGTFPTSCVPVRLNVLPHAVFFGVIDITPVFDPDQNCFQAFTENEYTLSSNQGKLPAGDYTVRFHPVTQEEKVEKQFTVEDAAADVSGCAAFDLFAGLLQVPDFELGGTSYTLDLRLVGFDPLIFELIGIDFGTPSAQPATYEFGGIIYIPCLNLSGRTYWSEWQHLPNADGADRMQLIEYGENP